MIYITGDVHGDWLSRLKKASFPEQKILTRNDYVFIAGDFGIWNNSPEENYKLDWLENRNFTTVFVEGNHSNYDILDELPIEMWHGGKVHFVRPHIIHLMRGQVYEICGKKIFTFGGALNSFTGSVTNFWKTNNLMTKLIGVLNIKKHLEKRTLFEDELKTIEFRNVSFSYNGSDENVLDNISFTIRSNEKFSLIGENGAGKSTLVKLLLGMYTPTKGAIYINGKIMDSEKYDYTPLFSAVFQDYKIFSFTVEDNIKMSEKELSEDEKERIRALLDSMGMQSVDTTSFVTQTFSDDGINFSGGETQKLAIVRALYKNAPIIVLDEPTSALSPQSEYEIYRSFNSLAENKTVLFISHRLSSCRICDKILLLHHGKLEAIGSHDELFGSNALYTEMFSAQAELFG